MPEPEYEVQNVVPNTDPDETASAPIYSEPMPEPEYEVQNSNPDTDPDETAMAPIYSEPMPEPVNYIQNSDDKPVQADAGLAPTYSEPMPEPEYEVQNSGEAVEYNIYATEIYYAWAQPTYYHNQSSPVFGHPGQLDQSDTHSIQPWRGTNHHHGWLKYALADDAGKHAINDFYFNVDPIAVLSDGSYIISSLEFNGSDFDVVAQRFAQNGLKIGEQTTVSSDNTGDQISPDAVGLADGGYVIVWQSNKQLDSDIKAQRYDAQGNAVGSELLVNPHSEAGQSAPTIIALDAGGFAVVWTSAGQDSHGGEVYMRLYSADGQALGDEIQVNDGIDVNHSNSDINQLSDGSLLVSWLTQNPIGDTQGNRNEVTIKRFSAEGEVLQQEISIATELAGDHVRPSVSALNNGGFVLSWVASEGHSGPLQVMLFDRPDSQTGELLQLESISADAYEQASIASLEDGSFMLSWIENSDHGPALMLSRYQPDSGQMTPALSLPANSEGSLVFEPHISALEGGAYMLSWSEVGLNSPGASLWRQQF
ncbi:MAG: hypothetical protein OIF38_02070, partial [Cellvibrionaceae bacterium]|nr:hypothetical protein [Cellvibrionaceae bacterium]